MSLISFYIFRFHIGPFLFGSSTVIFIFLMQFIIRYLDELLGKGLSEWVILQLIAYNIAWMTVLAVPLGVLFSTLMSFGNLSSSYEIAVMKSGGAGLFRLMRPSLIMGIVLTFSLFWFNDRILPDTNHKAKVLMSDIQRTRPTFSLASGKFSTDLYGYTIFARKLDSVSGLMQDVTIYDYSQNRQMNIVNADSGTILFTPDYNKMVLHLYKGEIHQSQNQTVKNYRKVNFNEYVVPIEASGFGFSKSEEGVMSRGQREMNIQDMSKIRDESVNRAKVYQVQMNTDFNKHIGYLLKGENEKSSEQNNELNVDEQKLKTSKNINTITNSNIKTEENYELEINSLNRNNLLNSNRNITLGNNSISNSQSNSLSQFTNINQKKTKAQIISNLNNRLSLLKSSLENNESQMLNNTLYANEYEVEIQKKYAIPFACLVFVFVGVPLGIRTKGGNIGISAVFTLGFYVVYWACLIGGETMADKGQISPILGMWLGNIILSTFGIIMAIKVNNEAFTLKNLFSKK